MTDARVGLAELPTGREKSQKGRDWVTALRPVPNSLDKYDR